MSFNYKNLVTLCSSWYLILKLYNAISKDKDDTHSVNTMLKLHTHRDDYYFLINHRDDCRQLSTRFRLIRFNHCYPEANRCETAWPGRVLPKVMISFCLIVRLWTLRQVLILIWMVCILWDVVLYLWFPSFNEFFLSTKKKKKPQRLKMLCKI